MCRLMTKIEEIKTEIENHLNNGMTNIVEIYDAIEAKGYKRPQIRQAKAQLLKETNQKLSVLQDAARHVGETS